MWKLEKHGSGWDRRTLIVAERNGADVKIRSGTEWVVRKQIARVRGNPAGHRDDKALAGGYGESFSVVSHPAADSFCKRARMEARRKITHCYAGRHTRDFSSTNRFRMDCSGEVKMAAGADADADSRQKLMTSNTLQGAQLQENNQWLSFTWRKCWYEINIIVFPMTLLLLLYEVFL